MTKADDIVIRGFQRFDADITKEYFYGYCRRAYLVLDSKYQLHNKAGLDFYSLAHDYYLQLLTHGFKQLTDRPLNMKLSSFMFKGFWFVTMNALKAQKKELENITDSDLVMHYVRSSDHEEGMMEQIAYAVSHYYHDRKMAELAWELFVLGYKQKEVSKELGMTPSAVNQRYKKMMEEVVTPFVIENYGNGIYYGASEKGAAPSAVCPSAAPDIRESRNIPNYVDECECCTPEISSNMTQIFYNENEKEQFMKLQRRTTPEFIASLQPDEIFVFGSNLRGIHAGGAARMAHTHFGAEMGNGVGLQGQSYAIPTMQGGVETIKPYVDEFIAFASQHKELHFLVTPIGCGIAGFEPEDIAPLFVAAMDMENISLPQSFWDELG